MDRVREVGDAVSARDWDRAEELTNGNRLGWEEVIEIGRASCRERV